MDGRGAPAGARELEWTRTVRRTAAALLLLAGMGLGACSGAEDDGRAGAPAERPAPPRAATPSGEATAARALPSPPAADAEAADSTLVALLAGTSLTAGLGLAPGDAYPAVLQRMADSAGLPVQVVNAGLSGETSAGLLRRLPWLLRERPADVILIETGANDGLRGLNVDSTLANLRRIVRTAREARPAAQLLVVQMEAPPNLGAEYTSRFRAMFPTVARESGATLVPFLLEGVAGEARFNQADGIHPNEAGARVVARTVWPAFEAAVEEALAAGASVAEAPENR